MGRGLSEGALGGKECLRMDCLSQGPLTYLPSLPAILLAMHVGSPWPWSFLFMVHPGLDLHAVQLDLSGWWCLLFLVELCREKG